MVVQIVLGESELNHLTSCCKGLEGLVEWLDSIDRRPGLTELDTRLTGLPVNVVELRKHIGYAEDGYQRNVLKKNEHYELVAVCWKPGQDTPIHDHIGSDCAFLIVEGTSTETQYQLNSEGFAEVTGQQTYPPGEVCAAGEPEIHRVSNEESVDLINLHVYTPPLSGFGIYQPAV
uniref:Cysteine dioxygenase (CDO1) n=1 Tax=uncultured marine group II/III euryarchaeote KM3_87_G11 TaxID=1456534 RepID=A0A075HZ46_9EURY|nr:Cysteine dioxygenase (CDO1) [uncultured marine group II/III euryarchaeote KM3_87_G11]